MYDMNFNDALDYKGWNTFSYDKWRDFITSAVKKWRDKLFTLFPDVESKYPDFFKQKDYMEEHDSYLFIRNSNILVHNIFTGGGAE